jgi:hypothetical protein
MAHKIPVEAYNSPITTSDEAESVSIKCITLFQPWASLVALSAKKIETRSWRTWYRGPLLIHASRAFPGWARELCKKEPYATILLRAGYKHPLSGLVDPGQLPRGAVVAACTLQHCVRIGTAGIALPPPEPERSFGDYAAGRYAWMLGDIQPLPTPIAARGSMGLWEPDEAVRLLLPPLNQRDGGAPEAVGKGG